MDPTESPLDRFDRYSRQVVLKDIGFEGQSRLLSARVLVAGIGGLGSLVSLQLAGMGVGRLRLADRDVVSRTDLHRQYIYSDSDAGRLLKVDSAKRRIRELNPDVDVEVETTAVDDDSVHSLVRGCDVVVDCLDSLGPKLSLSRECVMRGIPLVHGSAIEMFGEAGTFVPGRTACLGCFLGSVALEDEPPGCSVVGVHPSVLGVVGSMQTLEAVNLIVRGNASYEGELLFVDLRNPSFERVAVRRNPLCPVCGMSSGRLKYRAKSFEEACARDGKGTYFLQPSRRGRFDLGRLTRNAGIATEQEGNVARVNLGRGKQLFIRKDGGAVAQVGGRVGDKAALKTELEALYRKLYAQGVVE